MIKFLLFVLLYSFLKLVRIMAAATVLMAAALLVCQAGGYCRWRMNLTALAFVPLACLTGYSRIFYTGKLWRYTNQVQQQLTQEMAVCYFAVAGVLVLRYLYMHHCLRNRLKQMQKLKEEEYPLSHRMRKSPIQVYLTEKQCSPFAGGILRPYIVVPKYLKNMLSEKEFSAVLYHEAVHIRQGHVILLNIYAVLKIIWWIHPLIYILDAKLRENIEYSSDEASVMLGPLKACEYAGVMLKTLQMNKRYMHRQSITAFSDGCFEVLKKRFERLKILQNIRKPDDTSACLEYKKKLRRWGLGVAGVLVLGTAGAAATSLPRYTVLKEIAVYDEKMNPLTFDLKADGFFAKAEADSFFISPGELERLVLKYQPQGEYVIFSYDSIMKVPGTGGLGQAAAVSLKDASDVTMMGRYEWPDRLQVFVLKYLI